MLAMMRPRYATAVMAMAMPLGLPSLPAQAVEYGQLQAAQSEISFVSRQMGTKSSGNFQRFSADIHFDPAKPEQLKASLEVDLASINAGGREATEEVKGKDWFHVAQFPKARFTVSELKPLGPNRYEAQGQMTIKGRSAMLKAPVTTRQAGNHLILEGSFTLPRLQFGIGEGMWGDTSVVANEVLVNFRLQLSPR